MISNPTSRSEPVAHFGSNHPLSGRMFAFQPADRSYKIFHLRSNRQIGAKEHFRTNHPICSVMVGVVKQPTDRNYSQCRVKSTLLQLGEGGLAQPELYLRYAGRKANHSTKERVI
jgi:hypothetical protein